MNPSGYARITTTIAAAQSAARLTSGLDIVPKQVSFTSGQPKAYSRTPGVTRTFCADCGTSIGYTDEGLADEFYLTIGFMEHPERFIPQAHAYWRMRLPWIDFPDSLPRVDGVSRPRNPSFGNPSERTGKLTTG